MPPQGGVDAAAGGDGDGDRRRGSGDFGGFNTATQTPRRDRIGGIAGDPVAEAQRPLRAAPIAPAARPPRPSPSPPRHRRRRERRGAGLCRRADERLERDLASVALPARRPHGGTRARLHCPARAIAGESPRRSSPGRWVARGPRVRVLERGDFGGFAGAPDASSAGPKGVLPGMGMQAQGMGMQTGMGMRRGCKPTMQISESVILYMQPGMEAFGTPMRRLGL